MKPWDIESLDVESHECQRSSKRAFHEEIYRLEDMCRIWGASGAALASTESAQPHIVRQANIAPAPSAVAFNSDDAFGGGSIHSSTFACSLVVFS